jgi:hypothetical protein
MFVNVVMTPKRCTLILCLIWQQQGEKGFVKAQMDGRKWARCAHNGWGLGHGQCATRLQCPCPIGRNWAVKYLKAVQIAFGNPSIQTDLQGICGAINDGTCRQAKNIQRHFNVELGRDGNVPLGKN